jgi:hypothetical protein
MTPRLHLSIYCKKQFLLYLLATSAFLPHRLSGQCLTNGDFSQDGSCVTTVSCSTFGTCNGWTRAQGTPQILPYTYTLTKGNVTVTSYLAYMWANNNDGEGMYTNFAFQANHSYDARIIFAASGGSSGNLHIRAASGVSALAIDGSCGSGTPNLSAQQIGQYSGVTSGLVDQTFSFTANAAYPQLWMYPSNGSSPQYNLYVYEIYVCPSCTALLTYSSGTIPTGESAAGTIDAGGAGTVSIQPSATTILTATNEVDLLPSFQGAITGSGSFIAQIVPCNQSQNVSTQSTSLDTVVVTNPAPPTIEGIAANRTTAGQAATFQQNDVSSVKLQVYPTVSSGMITITGGLNDLENADIAVNDEVGRTVLRSHNEENTTISLDLGNLTNGIYFVQIRKAGKVTNYKVLISR